MDGSLTPDSSPAKPAPPPPRKRLAPGQPKASIIRDTDTMRLGIEGQLYDVSVAGIGILLDRTMPIGEQIKITLINDLQKVRKEVRGVVRHVTTLDDGQFQIGVELYTRLTPLEMSLLKMGLKRKNQGQQWF